MKMKHSKQVRIWVHRVVCRILIIMSFSHFWWEDHRSLDTFTRQIDFEKNWLFRILQCELQTLIIIGLLFGLETTFLKWGSGSSFHNFLILKTFFDFTLLNARISTVLNIPGFSNSFGRKTYIKHYTLTSRRVSSKV